MMEDSCWLWAGGTNAYGYGVVDKVIDRVRCRMQAHRVMYENVVGPIPKGLVIDHLCRVRACVNPDHMEVVTVRENVLRGVGLSAQYAKASHCVNGHEFTPENTRIYDGGRYCRACGRATYHKLKRLRKDAL